MIRAAAIVAAVLCAAAVADITLTYNRMDISADAGLTVMVYSAEPGSKSADALSIPGSWAATLDPANLAHMSSRA